MSTNPVKRHQELDFLRGCMLLMMTLDHLLWSAFRSIGEIADVTYEFFGAVSSADGFVFLSGAVAGLVYGRMLLQGRATEARQRLFARVKELYLINVLCIAALAGGAFLFSGGQAGISANPHYKHPIATLVLGAAHLALPSFLDILPIYCYFLLLLVPTLRALARGRVRLVLGLSAAGWLVGQAGPFQLLERALNRAFAPSLPFNLGFFDAFAWQFLFVVGATLGYLKTSARLPRFLTRPPRAAFVVALAVTVVLFLIRHHMISIEPVAIDRFLYTRTLGILRLVGLACLGYTLLVIAPRLPRLFAFPPLVFLGQHSLYVYAFHTMLCYGLMAAAAGRLSRASVAVNVVALLLALGSLWLPAGLHVLWRTRAPQLVRRLFPRRPGDGSRAKPAHHVF